MHQAAVHQNTLCAVRYPHAATGYKDPKDPCHRRSSTAYRRRAHCLPIRLHTEKNAKHISGLGSLDIASMHLQGSTNVHSMASSVQQTVSCVTRTKSMLSGVHGLQKSCELQLVTSAGASEAKGAFTPVDATPVRFRRDGVPISACRLPGRPLMVRRPPCGQQSSAGLGGLFGSPEAVRPQHR